MERLTKKEEELMDYFWQEDALFVKDLLDSLPEPKPHVNTISTIVRTLESKGYLSHRQFGGTYQYYTLIPKQEYSKHTLKDVISKYFKNSYLSAVSALVQEEDISVEELKRLIDEIDYKNKLK